MLPEFQTLVEIIARLRGPNGCPWDKEQTQKSLTPYIIEEAYELVEAIEGGSQSEIRDELGDFVFQFVLQAQVAADEGHFSVVDVLRGLNEKMIRRHPHVFGSEGGQNIEEVWKNWLKIKKEEKGAGDRALFNYPLTLPALQVAHKIGRKTQTYKFDWTSVKQVLAKVHEELAETEEAVTSAVKADIEHEIGDLLFTVAQLARHVGVDPETSLRETNRRFVRRFTEVLKLSGKSVEEFSEMSDSVKEALWLQAKKNTD